MALDIKALAANAFVLAKDLAAQAFEPITVRLNPTTSVAIAADVETTTWEHEIAVTKALRFDESDEKVAALPKSRLKNFLVDMTDLPDGLALDKVNEDSELEDGDGVIWEIFQAEVDPTGSSAIFYARKNKTAPTP